MDNHYLPHTDLIQKAINLSEQTLFDIKRVAYEVESINRIEQPDYGLKERVIKIIEEFNQDQYFCALRGRYDTPKELIDGWIKQQKVVQIKLTQRPDSKKYCLAFYTAHIGFEQFYKHHSNAFPEYRMFFEALSTLCAMVYDNILLATTGDNPLSTFYLYTFSEKNYAPKKNPYKKFGVLPVFETILSQDLLLKPKQVKNALKEIVNRFHPEQTIKHFPGSATKWLLVSLAQGWSISDIVQSVIYFSWLTSNNLFTDTIMFNAASAKEITRHVSWCVHEKRRRCLLMSVDCHSSIDCPFYERDPSK